MPKSVAVFCGSRPGHNPAWLAACRELGDGLAASGIRLVYGGGSVGLMGALADAVLAGGGQVVGVMPAFLTEMEVAHHGLTELKVTGDMHSRKRMMFEQADAFVTMPGGLGTLDETVEVVTWRQLGLHKKPMLLCNVGNWADGLLAAFERSVADGFASAGTRSFLDVLPDVPAVLARLRSLRETPAAPGDRL